MQIALVVLGACILQDVSIYLTYTATIKTASVASPSIQRVVIWGLNVSRLQILWDDGNGA